MPRSRIDSSERSIRLKPGTSVNANAAVTNAQTLLKILEITSIKWMLMNGNQSVDTINTLRVALTCGSLIFKASMAWSIFILRWLFVTGFLDLARLIDVRILMASRFLSKLPWSLSQRSYQHYSVVGNTRQPIERNSPRPGRVSDCMLKNEQA